MPKVYLFAFRASDERIILKVGFTTQKIIKRYSELLSENPFKSIKEGILLKAVSVPGDLVRKVEKTVKQEFWNSAEWFGLRKTGHEWFEVLGKQEIVPTIELFNNAITMFSKAVAKRVSEAEVLNDVLLGEVVKQWRNNDGTLIFHRHNYCQNRWPKKLTNDLHKAPGLCESEKSRLMSLLMSIVDVRKRLDSGNYQEEHLDGQTDKLLNGVKVYIFAFRGKGSKTLLKIGISTRTRLLLQYSDILDSHKFPKEKSIISHKLTDGILLSAAIVPKASSLEILGTLRKELTRAQSEWAIKRCGNAWFELVRGNDIEAIVNLFSKSTSLFWKTLNNTSWVFKPWNEGLSGSTNRCRKVNGKLTNEVSQHSPSSWPQELLNMLKTSPLQICEKDTLRDLLLEIPVFKTEELPETKVKLTNEEKQYLSSQVETKEAGKTVEEKAPKRIEENNQEIETSNNKEVKQKCWKKNNRGKSNERNLVRSAYISCSLRSWENSSSFYFRMKGITPNFYHSAFRKMPIQVSSASYGQLQTPFQVGGWAICELKSAPLILRRWIIGFL